MSGSFGCVETKRLILPMRPYVFYQRYVMYRWHWSILQLAFNYFIGITINIFSYLFEFFKGFEKISLKVTLKKMTKTLEISPYYLTNKEPAASFLNHRRRLARDYGSNAVDERDFIEADSDPNRSSSAFRGINHLNPSPFGTRPLKDFRSILKPKFDGLTNPDTYVNDGVIDNHYQITPESPGIRGIDPRSAEKPDYSDSGVSDWIYLKQHPKTADQLANNQTLRDSYNDDRFSSDFSLEQQNAEYARRRLDFHDPLDDDYFAANPEEAKLIGLNIGGSADTLNADPGLADGLTEEPRVSYSADIRSDLAQAMSAKMDSETGLDEDFFLENPEAAVYLDKRPGLISMFNQRPDDAQNFKRYYGSLKSHVVEDAMDSVSSALSGQGSFVEGYLDDNPEFAVDAAVDSRLKSGDSINDNIILNDSLRDKNTFTDDLYRDQVVSRADEALGYIEGLDRDYLKEHPQLAYAIQKSGRLAVGIRGDPDTVRFFGVSAGTAGHRVNIGGSLRAFSTGYPLRNSSIVDLWT